MIKNQTEKGREKMEETAKHSKKFQREELKTGGRPQEEEGGNCKRKKVAFT
jgi:hypothetical protein